MRNHRTITTGILLGCLFFSTVASAQTIMQMLGRSGLTQEDLNIMSEAASELYASGNAVVGDDTIWANPKTDAYGMSEITEVTGNCVGIAQRFRVDPRSRTRTILVRRCLVEGKWVLSD